jgi:hypothetical protein
MWVVMVVGLLERHRREPASCCEIVLFICLFLSNLVFFCQRTYLPKYLHCLLFMESKWNQNGFTIELANRRLYLATFIYLNHMKQAGRNTVEVQYLVVN